MWPNLTKLHVYFSHCPHRSRLVRARGRNSLRRSQRERPGRLTDRDALVPTDETTRTAPESCCHTERSRRSSTWSLWRSSERMSI